MNEANDLFNISKIESYLYSLLYGTLTKQTYVGTLPDTIKDGWNEMCLIDCSSDILDEDARARGVAFVSLFARPNTDGSKNVPKMSQLEQRLNEIIRNSDNPHYSISRYATYADYDSKRNWHVNTVQLNITIY
jgi:hypothetical protein